MKKDDKIKTIKREVEGSFLSSRRDFLEKGKMVALALLGVTIGAGSAEGQVDKNKHFRTVEIPGIIDDDVDITDNIGCYNCQSGNCIPGCNLCPCNSQCRPSC